jgi:endonuclease/exonuclease/phosphatase family metal-dependent hydrolase
MPLRLGTFNVWGLPEAFADDVSARMRGLASRLQGVDLDVLFIQEAWTDEVRDTLRKAALAADFEVAEGLDSGGGLMVFSRLPIRTSEFESFRFRGDPERLAKGEFLGGKGFQTLTLECENGPFSVINTHLHARYRRFRPQLNSAVRTAQMMQIIGAMNELDGTVVVGGDFNCTKGDAEYRIFRALTHAVELGDGRSHPTLAKSNYYKRNRKGPDKRVDYLFVRPDPGVLWNSFGAASLFDEPELIRRRDRSLSDHFGFQAAFEWSPMAIRPQLRVSPAPEPDPKIFELVRVLLRIGQEEADRRERVHFRSASGWALGAALAVGLRRHPAIQRRRFLRTSSAALALFALTPAIGYGALARVDSDNKRDAFDDANEILVQLETRQVGTT